MTPKDEVVLLREENETLRAALASTDYTKDEAAFARAMILAARRMKKSGGNFTASLPTNTFTSEEAAAFFMIAATWK
jgi:hypothetical protein